MRPFDVARRFFHRWEWQQLEDNIDDDDNNHGEGYDDVDCDDNGHGDVASDVNDKDEDALASHGCEFWLTR